MHKSTRRLQGHANGIRHRRRRNFTRSVRRLQAHRRVVFFLEEHEGFKSGTDLD
ncbi:MAG: hypothetical protein K6A65_04385 [Succinivibrionaceae bacterium]|nr:hypothetical protein [Succinivibrionaceae bacterium]